jgi:hypothetical protein
MAEEVFRYLYPSQPVRISPPHAKNPLGEDHPVGPFSAVVQGQQGQRCRSFGRPAWWQALWFVLGDGADKVTVTLHEPEISTDPLGGAMLL